MLSAWKRDARGSCIIAAFERHLDRDMNRSGVKSDGLWADRWNWLDWHHGRFQTSLAKGPFSLFLC